MVAFIGGIHVGSVRRGTRGLVCRSEERNDEESVSSSEGEPLLSRREAREKAAKEREDRIRKRREERRKRLDVMDGLVTPEEAAELEEEVKVMPDGNYGENASGVFGWVNQNPSSKNAVYMQPFKGGKYEKCQSSKSGFVGFSSFPEPSTSGVAADRRWRQHGRNGSENPW